MVYGVPPEEAPDFPGTLLLRAHRSTWRDLWNYYRVSPEGVLDFLDKPLLLRLLPLLPTGPHGVPGGVGPPLHHCHE